MARKTEKMMIRTTPDHRKRLERKANEAGLTLSEYLRRLVAIGEALQELDNTIIEEEN